MSKNACKTSIKTEIMNIVAAIGDPLLRHIVQRTGHGKTAVEEAVRELVKDGMLRMKEDSYDHEWSYISTRRGDEVYKNQQR